MASGMRYVLRGFQRSPSFACVAILSIALGIGANTAIFSLVNAVLFRTLPVHDPDRLVIFGLNRVDSFGFNPISRALYRKMAEQNTVLAGFAGVTFPPITLSNAGVAERLTGLLVSGNFFETLGVHAWIGRLLTPEDDRIADSPSVCVIGYGLWQRRFGRDPSVIGRRIQINGRPFTVIGVTPQAFIGLSQGSELDISIPLKAAGMSAFAEFPLLTFGRLKPGVSAAQAQTSLDVLYHQLETHPYVGKLSELHVVLQPGSQGLSRLRKQYARPLLLLMVVVGLVLLIACANVTNLLMARASVRAKEIAVRLALGAGRIRLIRQLLAESTLISISGALLGIGLAYAVDHTLLALAPRQPGGDAPAIDVNPDWRVLLFTLVIAILVSFVSGIAPALQSTRSNLTLGLKGEAGVRAPGRFSFASALVVGQVALSLVLLIGAGLFLRSLRNLKSVDPGLDPARLIVLTIDAGSAGYSQAASQGFFDRLVERARRLPGVVAASPGFISPLSGDFAITGISVPGYQPRPGEPDSIAVNWIGTDYFKTLGTPLVAGRGFTEQDGRSNQAAIVNANASSHFWPHESPIGKHFILSGGDDREVVGIVGNVKSESLRQDAEPTVYVPFRQNRRPHMTLHVRVAGETTPVIQALIRESRALDPNLPIFNPTTMAVQLNRTIALDRLMAMLTALFALLAVVLASVGLYGVMAFAVGARTREIGIRVALGASQGRVLGLVMAESATLTSIGIALGVPAALSASRAVSSSLYGLSANDPLTYAFLVMALAGIALGAAWIPARRAARVDPMAALRYE